MVEKLKPCPLCGSQDVTDWHGGDYWRVPQRGDYWRCKSCGCTASKKAWNARTPSRNDVLEEAAKAAWGAQIYPVEDMTTDPALWAAFRYGKDCAVAAIRARKNQTDAS